VTDQSEASFRATTEKRQVASGTTPIGKNEVGSQEERRGANGTAHYPGGKFKIEIDYAIRKQNNLQCHLLLRLDSPLRRISPKNNQ